jgi:hypothetical protein
VARSSETWVRPPVVASELRSAAFARWRFRLVALAVLVAVVAGFVLLFLRFSNVTGGEDPGIGGLRAPQAVLLAAR